VGLVIWPIGVGWKARPRTVQTGPFECQHPDCKGRRTSATQQYRVREYRNWIVVFYVPVIPLNTLGATIECASCKTAYSPDVLRAT
jgi:hypothetical protein